MGKLTGVMDIFGSPRAVFALEAAPAFNHEPTELHSVFCIWEVMDLEVGAGTDREKSLDLMVYRVTAGRPTWMMFISSQERRN